MLYCGLEVETHKLSNKYERILEIMATNYITMYKNVLTDMLDRIHDTQQENIDKVAQMMADTIREGGSLYAFGPSHAGMIVEEMVYRAGGLALMNPVHIANLMPNCRPMNLTPSLERLPGFATAYFERLNIKEGDFLLIHSVSARIPIVVEMAMQAKKHGVKLAGIVNLDFATKVTSLDPSGKMMQEICDVVIDDCGEVGDASIQIEGIDAKVAPTSTISGCFIANALVIRTCEKLLAAGVEPPVIRSGNIDGCNEKNAELFKQYPGRIHYLN